MNDPDLAELDALAERVGVDDTEARYLFAFMRAATHHPEPEWDAVTARVADIRSELCGFLELDDGRALGDDPTRQDNGRGDRAAPQGGGQLAHHGVGPAT
jgi:hypothetical protein